MDGISWIRSLDPGAGGHREAEWLDVLVYAEQEHGARASRWLADELGVDIRSAQRYLHLDHQPRRQALQPAVERLRRLVEDQWQREDREQRRQDVADLLRLIKRVAPGRVRVKETSSGRGYESDRSIKGELDVDFGPVAAAWEDEDPEAAALALSDAIVRAYGDRGGIDELQGNLEIVQYYDGIDW